MSENPRLELVPEPPEALSTSMILGGRYRLIRQLVEGGMGSVWYAEHLTLRSPVAVKLIALDGACNEEALQRFMHEARAGAALRSPHVVQILDYGVHEGLPYIVMELLVGESLADRLNRVGPLGIRTTERIISQVARALTRAHEAGIIHRDLKPENIFLVDDEDDLLVKLLDFGIAKSVQNSFTASVAAQSTRTGMFIGTPQYASPEQVEGVKTLDHRTDIWSMGVVAYECLLGQPLFDGDTVGKIMVDVCAQPLPVPSSVGYVPDGFDEWFARTCARDPDERFQSAREAAQELTRICGGPTLDEPASSQLAWRGARPKRRPRSRLSATKRFASAALLACAGVAAGFTLAEHPQAINVISSALMPGAAVAPASPSGVPLPVEASAEPVVEVQPAAIPALPLAEPAPVAPATSEPEAEALAVSSSGADGAAAESGVQYSEAAPQLSSAQQLSRSSGVQRRASVQSSTRHASYVEALRAGAEEAERADAATALGTPVSANTVSQTATAEAPTGTLLQLPQPLPLVADGPSVAGDEPRKQRQRSTRARTRPQKPQPKQPITDMDRLRDPVNPDVVDLGI